MIAFERAKASSCDSFDDDKPPLAPVKTPLRAGLKAEVFSLCRETSYLKERDRSRGKRPCATESARAKIMNGVVCTHCHRGPVHGSLSGDIGWAGRSAAFLWGRGSCIVWFQDAATNYGVPTVLFVPDHDSRCCVRRAARLDTSPIGVR